MLTRLACLKRIPALCLLLFFSQGLFAQSVITGRVINKSDNTPVQGATVQVQGSKLATQTGTDGTFTLTSSNAIKAVIITVVGYNPETVSIDGRSALGDIAVSVTTTSLNDVVVTGYTSQKKKDITGSVAVVDVTSLKSVPGGNTASLLQGQAAGVTVINSGTPGGGANVRVRGITSFGNSDPLYVIDGVQVANGLQDLNPADIENIQVLKDAGAAAIYGVRGSNGVVIVTTRRGRAGKNKVTYDGYVGSQQPLKGNVFDIATPQESGDALFAQFKNSGIAFTPDNFKNSQYGYGATPVLYDYLTPINTNNGGPNTDPSTYKLYTNEITKTNKTGTDWFHEVFKPALIQSHNVSASGGGDRSSYYFSMNYFDQQGTLINTYLKRYSVRMNTSFNIKDHIRVGENAYVFYKSTPGIPGSSNQNEGNAIAMTYRMSPLIPVYDVVGNYAGTQVKGLGNPQNPVATLQRSANNKSNDWQVTGNVFAEADFLKHFTARTSVGGNFDNYYYTQFSYTSYENTENNTNPNQFLEGAGYNSSYTWTNTLKYNNVWGKHAVNVIVGSEAIKNYSRGFQATRGNYYITDANNLTVDPNLWTLNFGSGSTQTNANLSGLPSQSSLFSLFGRLDYTFNEKYIFAATLRRDGSSIFADPVRFGYFPSFTGGWRISQEDFMKNISWLQDLKIRGGWGKLGSLSNTIATNQYFLYGQVAANSSYDITGSSTSSVLGTYSSQLGNPKGTWEQDVQTNIGFDASFLNSFDLSFDWYKKSVSGLLFNKSLNAFTGGAAPAYVNVGDVENKGVDLALTYHGGRGKPFTFDVTGTFTSYKNTVKSLGGLAYVTKTSAGGSRFGAFTRLQPGQAIGAFYGYKVIGLFQNQQQVDASNQPDAAIGRFRYQDVNKDGKISDSDRTFFGNPNPKFVAGLNFSAAYGGFDLSFFLYASVGNDNANYVKYWTDFPQVFDAAVSKRAALNSFGEPNANGKTPILERSANFSNTTVFNSYYLEKGSYLRMKQIQLGYTISPKLLNRIGVDRFRVYVQVANLFTITKYSGLDPELQTSDLNDNTNFGIDFGNYPANQKNYNIGVQLGF